MTVLYRLRDNAGALLYVGISDRWSRRMDEHERKQPWWPAVAHAELTTYRTRQEAVSAEREAIRNEKPRHNVVHQPGNRHPAPVVSTVDYAALVQAAQETLKAAKAEAAEWRCRAEVAEAIADTRRLSLELQRTIIEALVGRVEHLTGTKVPR